MQNFLTFLLGGVQIKKKDLLAEEDLMRQTVLKQVISLFTPTPRNT